MNSYVEKVKGLIKRGKKKIIITSIFVVAVGVIGVILIYNKANDNVNYTVEEAKTIALGLINGEVVSVKKELEIDLGKCSFEYKFKIKDSNNMLKEVTVDSHLGFITDVDSYND